MISVHNFKLLEHSKKLIRVLEVDLENIPKKHLELKKKILDNAYIILEKVIHANYYNISKKENIITSIKLVEEAIVKLSMMSFLIDYAFDLKILGKKKYVKIGKIISDVEKYAKGWHKFLQLQKD